MSRKEVTDELAEKIFNLIKDHPSLLKSNAFNLVDFGGELELAENNISFPEAVKAMAMAKKRYLNRMGG